MRRATTATQNQQQDLDSSSAEDELPASTIHHESALVFALMLSLLFSPSDSSGAQSDGFYSTLLWPALQTKFAAKWSHGTDAEIQQYASESGRPMERLPLLPLVTVKKQTQFEQACRSLTSTSAAQSPSAGSIHIFLRMIMESVGMDWIVLRHSLQRLGLPDVGDDMWDSSCRSLHSYN